MKRPLSEPLNSNPENSDHLRVHHSVKAIVSLAAIIILSIASLNSCKNDLEVVYSLDFNDTLPIVTARDIEMLYSESAKVQIKLVSPLLIRYEGTDPYLEFPEGFIVYFYDTNLNVKSTISADYGISHEKDKIMEARYNVVVVNVEKNEKLNTEELFWDQAKEIIYSNKFVKVTRDDEVITGDGLKADQTFQKIDIDHPKGLIEIDESEDE